MKSVMQMEKTMRSITKKTMAAAFCMTAALTIPDCKGNMEDYTGKDLISMTILNQQNGMAMRDMYVLVSDALKSKFDIIHHDHMTHSNMLHSPVTTTSAPGNMIATANDHLYLLLPNENKVSVYDASMQPPMLLTTVNTGVGSNKIYEINGAIWVMNDGDNTGVDTDTTSGDCATPGSSSVTVIADGAKGAMGANGATFVKKICVGKGRHVAVHAMNKNKIYVANAIGGSIDVIDANSASANYLNVIQTIDTCDTNHAVQTAADATCTNPTLDKSNPRGIAYSPATGMVYGANTGYGTVIKIDPATDTITKTVNPGFSGMLHTVQNGNYLVTNGFATGTASTTTKTGKLTVIKLADDTFVTTDIPDGIPSHFMTGPDGTRLYVVTTQGFMGAGSPDLNLKSSLFVYDATALPNLTLVKEVAVGASSAMMREFAMVAHGPMLMGIFVPNFDNGTVSVIDPMMNMIHETFTTTGNPTSIMTLFGGGHTH